MTATDTREETGQWTIEDIGGIEISAAGPLDSPLYDELCQELGDPLGDSGVSAPQTGPVSVDDPMTAPVDPVVASTATGALEGDE